jgi:hypothetical protein
MKTGHSEQNDEALSKALRQWQVTKPLPPSFQDQVWRRIEDAEALAPAWVRVLQRAGAALTRPATAIGYVTILLLAGLSVGYWQAHAANARADAALSSLYVQAVAHFQHLNP